MKTVTFDETKWKLVPIEPTEEMISGALCGRVMPQSCDAIDRIRQQMKSDIVNAIAAAPEYQEPRSAIAPDPRMNEPWTEEERKDLRTAVTEIFNWKQEPIKAMICSRCGSDRFKEPCKQQDMQCPMVATAHNKDSEG